MNMSDIRPMSALEFVKRLKASCIREDEKYAFFLGAGCSVSSGIPVCSTLIEKDWLPKLFEIENYGDVNYKDWYETQKEKYDSENAADIYGNVISRLFKTPQQRQNEIERICKGTLPGFGYGVLSMLVSSQREKFNVITTTNFDSLVSDAMFLFTNYHPLVISHESLADFIRPTTSKPIIIKLHHDAKLAPCNTSAEVGKIAPEMQEKFQSLMYDRGLIFIGYGGNDEGIYQMLNQLPQIALPYGVYWINGEEPNSIIRPWLEKRNAFWINQLDFDEFMLIIKDEFDLPDPDRKHIDQVFNNYYEKLNTLSRSIESRDPNAEATKLLDKALRNSIEGITDPYGFHLKAESVMKKDPDLADQIYRAGLDKYPESIVVNGNYANFLTDIKKDYDRAEEFYKRAVELDPDYAITIGNYASFLYDIRKDHDRAEEFYKRALELDPKDANQTGNYAGNLLSIGNKDIGREYLSRAIKFASEMNFPTDLFVEIYFYAFVHWEERERVKALRELKKYLIQGLRSNFFLVTLNAEVTKKEDYPDSDWIEKLARVIREQEDISVLDDWPAWREA